MSETTANLVRVSFVSTYPPRRCGIGTFTCDLASALAQKYGEPLGTSDSLQIVALNNTPHGYNYDSEVRFEIRAHHNEDYRNAADYLNLSPVDVVNVQHEFGIFGGEDGAFILSLLANLKKPAVTTVHTVLNQPTPSQLETLQSVCSYSSIVVVLSKRAAEFLVNIYKVPEEKIRSSTVAVPTSSTDTGARNSTSWF